MRLNSKEIEAVIKLKPFDRYQYFLKRIVDFEEVVVLVDEDGEWATVDIKDKVAVLVWPAAAYAELNALAEWSNFKAQSIALSDFIEKSVGEISQNGELLDVFSMNGKSGFVVSVEEILRDIENEESKY